MARIVNKEKTRVELVVRLSLHEPVADHILRPYVVAKLREGVVKPFDHPMNRNVDDVVVVVRPHTDMRIAAVQKRVTPLRKANRASKSA